MRNYTNYNLNQFFFLWVSYSVFFIQGNLPYLKCEFPPKIPVWLMTLLCQPSEKLLTQGVGGANYGHLEVISINLSTPSDIIYKYLIITFSLSK